MVPTQAGLGLRIGELLGLRASDVDILRRSMRIECQIPPGARERTEPKTPRSRRSIPLPTSLAEELAQHMADFPPAPDGSLFSTRFGGCYLHAYYGTTIFQAARRRVGLPEGTTTHDLRPHYASVLLAAGESVVAVAERLGHEDAQLVLSTYGHLMTDSAGRTRRALDAAWSRTPSVPRQAEEVP
jgi:integrase